MSDDDETSPSQLTYNTITTPANAANTIGTAAKNPAPERAMAMLASDVFDVAAGAPEDVEPVLCEADPDPLALALVEAEAVLGYKTELVKVVHEDVAGMTAGELPGGS
jgi:hypothetical protein